MTPEPDFFLHKAQEIGLSKAEREAIREKLTIHVRKSDNERLHGRMNQQNFLSMAKSVSLAPNERVLMKELLIESMQKQSPQSWFQPFSLRLSRAIPACMAVLLMGASVSFAAESAVPGDFLYSTKVKFNEEILVRSEFTVEGRAKMEAFRIGRRLQEARILAEKSQLEVDKILLIQHNLDAHIKALESDLARVSAQNPELAGTIAVDIETTVAAHENLLIEKITDSSNPIRDIVEKTRKVRMVVEKVAVQGETDNSVVATGNKAKDEILKVRLELKTKKDAAVAEALFNAEADLKVSADAKASEDLRLQKAKSALRKAKEATIMMHSKTSVKTEGATSSSSTSSATSEQSSSQSTSSSSAATSSSAEANASASAGIDTKIDVEVPKL